jgi:hypothetical protein
LLQERLPLHQFLLRDAGGRAIPEVAGPADRLQLGIGRRACGLQLNQWLIRRGYGNGNGTQAQGNK